MLSPTTCPPSVSRSALLGSVQAGAAAWEGWTDYLIHALDEGKMPWDVGRDLARWTQVVGGRRKPDWASPNELVWRTELMALRDFSQGARDDVVPTLVLPPQAGHHSCIVDYSPRQSQMKTIRAAGLTRAWALEWIGATPATKHATIDGYLAEIRRAVETIGGPVNLVGDCQGGWLAAIYAALYPEDINTLTVAGAPIDFHAGDPVIGGYVELLDRSFYRALVASGRGVLKGEYLLGGFIAIKPHDEVARQMQLLCHLDDAEHLERYAHFEDWFKYTQDLAGDFYLWIVEHLFRRNSLIAGELEIGGRTVDLGRITCPVMLLAGSEDHITPPPQVFEAARYVGTPADEIHTRLASGGHLGLFMGRESLRDHWPVVLAEVMRHSVAGEESGAVRKKAIEQTPSGDAPEQPVP